jgi:hypothetical protein
MLWGIGSISLQYGIIKLIILFSPRLTHKNNYLNFVTLNKSHYYISVEKRNFPCISFVKMKLFSIITSLLLLSPSAVMVSFNILELIDKATHIRL